jgi:sialic acid synthase SpsE
MYGEPKQEYANLRFMERLQKEFPEIAIGYSDHTEGIEACKLALKMKASIIEVHFTDDKTREFRDHALSATKEEIRELLGYSPTEAIANEEILLGTGEDLVTAIETPERIREFRRAVYPKVDMAAGEILTEDKLITLRPRKGIDARDYYSLLGKEVKQEIKAFAVINENALKDE